MVFTFIFSFGWISVKMIRIFKLGYSFYMKYNCSSKVLHASQRKDDTQRGLSDLWWCEFTHKRGRWIPHVVAVQHQSRTVSRCLSTTFITLAADTSCAPLWRFYTWGFTIFLLKRRFCVCLMVAPCEHCIYTCEKSHSFTGNTTVIEALSLFHHLCP